MLANRSAAMEVFTMRRLVTCLMVLATLAGLSQFRGAAHAADEPELVTSTVVYLVRHAEKVNDGSRDPALSETGVARAARLARMLRDESIAAVYCTPTTRSRETGRPMARLAGIDVAEYAPMDAAGLAARIRSEQAGGRALVVAHSNTVPMILAALGGPTIPDLNEADEYDRLFVVVLDPAGDATTLNLRF